MSAKRGVRASGRSELRECRGRPHALYSNASNISSHITEAERIYTQLYEKHLHHPRKKKTVTMPVLRFLEKENGEK